jgi:hypothetical protein
VEQVVELPFVDASSVFHRVYPALGGAHSRSDPALAMTGLTSTPQ